jgi:hypothetical protein
MKPVFTRYLYVKNDVIWTLFHVIIWGDLEQSLFWAYELYYSGFQEETFELLQFIYESCYKHVNPCQISKFLENTYAEWKTKPNQDWLLATYLANIVYRKHDILGFIKKYDSYEYEYELEASDLPSVRDSMEKKKIVYVHYSDKDIQSYKTVLPSNKSKNLHVSNILKTLQKYQTRIDGAEHCSKLRQSHMSQYLELPYLREKIDAMLLNASWLYYASATPIWKQRIESHKGVSKDDTESVEFNTNNLKKAFYSKYGYITITE